MKRIANETPILSSLRCIFTTTGGSRLHPLYVETTEKGYFPPVSQTYETSNASHPISTSRDRLYAGTRRAK
eukprot:6367891-Ditylum_brightwellii.AAC.1